METPPLWAESTAGSRPGSEIKLYTQSPSQNSAGRGAGIHRCLFIKTHPISAPLPRGPHQVPQLGQLVFVGVPLLYVMDRSRTGLWRLLSGRLLELQREGETSFPSERSHDTHDRQHMRHTYIMHTLAHSTYDIQHDAHSARHTNSYDAQTRTQYTHETHIRHAQTCTHASHAHNTHTACTQKRKQPRAKNSWQTQKYKFSK